MTNTVCLFSVTFISWKSGEKNYNKIHLARLVKAYILKFLCVQRFISMFLIPLRAWFHQRFLVSLFYLRFDQVDNKLQQPIRNQRQVYKVYKMSTLRPTFLIMFPVFTYESALAPLFFFSCCDLCCVSWKFGHCWDCWSIV